MFSFFKKHSALPEHAIAAVADGNLVPLENVKDPAFAEKMLGDGIAIDPLNGEIVSPCKGTITMIYPTMHALIIACDNGPDILIHIGVNTVQLDGKGFTRHVAEGSRIEPGDRIISFDSKYLYDEKLDFTIMMLFPESKTTLHFKRSGYVRKGKDIVATYE